MVTVSHYTVDTVHLMDNIYYSKSQGRKGKKIKWKREENISGFPYNKWAMGYSLFSRNHRLTFHIVSATLTMTTFS